MPYQSKIKNLEHEKYLSQCFPTLDELTIRKLAEYSHGFLQCLEIRNIEKHTSLTLNRGDFLAKQDN